MKHVIEAFRGESPRTTPRALPDNAAQAAVNARMLTGDLTAWKQFALNYGLHNGAAAVTISRIGPTGSQLWMSWVHDVDVARGTTPGDTTYRTYITGPDLYSQPRFTTLASAVAGDVPTTRPLGVPAPESPPSLVVGVDPTATTFSINTLDEGDVLNTKWVRSASTTGATFSTVTQEAGYGNPASCYALTYDEIHNEGEQPFAYRNFGIAGASALHVSTDFMMDGDVSVKQAIFQFASTLAGVGFQVRYEQGFLKINTSTAWSPYAVSEAATTTAAGVADSVWHTLAADASVNGDGTISITATLSTGSAQVATLTATVTGVFGDYCGMTNGSANDASTQFRTNYDNILVQASGSTGFVPTNLATSYVYTFVNDLAQESAPSLPSATILRPDGVTVTVTTPVAIPSGVDTAYGIASKRLYRSVTGSTGTAFQFITELPLATADYVDVLTDAELGEVLQSELWALPPADLRGILALPNGIMAGFSKNQLCLSAQNHPHAWPVEYRLNTDTDIVTIGNVDTTVVIGTKSFVYVASGNAPDAYSMAKSEVPYACVSKRSLAYLPTAGVVFAGPDGLMAVIGPGQVRNLTETVFTRRQWQALVPSSILGVAHNDIYWLFYNTGSAKGCYAIDMKPTGFGIAEMAFHATAAYADPVEGKLYLTLDTDAEPDDASLPVHPETPVYLAGTAVYEFDGGATAMVYRWRSKLWLEPAPTTYLMVQVKAEDYSNLLLRLYGDGAQIHESAVASAAEFVVEQVDAYTTFEVELLGTSTVRTVQVVQDVAELD